MNEQERQAHNDKIDENWRFIVSKWEEAKARAEVAEKKLAEYEGVSFEEGVMTAERRTERAEEHVRLLRGTLSDLHHLISRGAFTAATELGRKILAATTPEPATKTDEPWFHGNNPDCLGHNDK